MSVLFFWGYDGSAVSFGKSKKAKENCALVMNVFNNHNDEGNVFQIFYCRKNWKAVNQAARPWRLFVKTRISKKLKACRNTLKPSF